MQPTLSHLGIACPLGTSASEVLSQLTAGSTRGMLGSDAIDPPRSHVVGRVRAALPPLDHAPPHLRSRNNQLLLAALEPLRGPLNDALRRYGRGRVGVVLGTTTSGIAEAEAAFRERARSGALPEGFDYRQMELGNPSEFLAGELGTHGPVFTISTACSSSANALLAGRRLLLQGLCDAVLAGGADTLSAFTLAGFGSLDALSPELCNPMSRNRRGINLGEGAALFLMTPEAGPVRLAGGSASSVAYHVSAPDPQAVGATLAMQGALADASLAPDAIHYLNLHGTATKQNDSMESRAVAAVLGAAVPVSSTKPLTGHALGAAGALEAAFCWLLLSGANVARRLPPHVFDGELDPELPRLSLVTAGQSVPELRRVMSNSFGFFGNNATLIFEACA
jgi:3-oxoacyl-[acyl-carrier-protein] synthase-1